MGRDGTLESGRFYSSRKRIRHWHPEPSFEASYHVLRRRHIDREDLALQADSNHVQSWSGILVSIG